MLFKRGVVPSEQVVVVDSEGASGEVADVVGDDIAGGVVLVGGQLCRMSVVAKKGVGGLHDTSAAHPDAVVGCMGADGGMGVLDGGVGEDDAALLGGVLPLVGIAFHDDALPHLPVACIGERAATHHQRTARTHDDARRVNHFQSASYGQRCKTVNHNVLVHLSGKIPCLGRRNNIGGGTISVSIFSDGRRG